MMLETQLLNELDKKLLKVINITKEQKNCLLLSPRNEFIFDLIETYYNENLQQEIIKLHINSFLPINIIIFKNEVINIIITFFKNLFVEDNVKIYINYINIYETLNNEVTKINISYKSMKQK